MGGKRKWDWMQREQLDFFANTFLAMGLIVMDVPNQARLLLVALQEARQSAMDLEELLDDDDDDDDDFINGDVFLWTAQQTMADIAYSFTLFGAVLKWQQTLYKRWTRRPSGPPTNFFESDDDFRSCRCTPHRPCRCSLRSKVQAI